MKCWRDRSPPSGAWSVVTAAILALHAAHGLASDEAVTPEVRWHATATPEATLAPGAAVTVRIDANISAGWHVYAFHQATGGPTALSITVADNSTATASGTVTGPPPSRQHDQSFDLDTETYSGSVQLLLPLEIKSDLTAGRHQLPVKIRFQSCSESECRPPRTLQLDVDLNIAQKT
jgi:hypothetical protein